jgi:CubicO group peptidase (beta-lactamase class C family)
MAFDLTPVTAAPYDLNQVDSLLRSACPQVCPALQIVVYQSLPHHPEFYFARAYGGWDPTHQELMLPDHSFSIQPDTRFDLASITKLFTATALMRLVEAGALQLDQPVCTVLPELTGTRAILPYEDPLTPGEWIWLCQAGSVNADQITFRHLLTHTSGLPAWRPLYRQSHAQAARQMALTTFFSYPSGSRILYSDIGFILLGLAIERLTADRLDRVVHQLILDPLSLHHTGFHPLDPRSDPIPPTAPTEWCRWRQRRIVGEVHDENAARLGGIAGHAGLFSTAVDLAQFGKRFLHQGQDLLRPESVEQMVHLQAQSGSTRRGLGFALRSCDPEASSYPFSQNAFGHTGFTGTSLWIDPDRSLVVACLSNAVYHGRVDRGFQRFRVALHHAIVEAVEGGGG